MHERSYVSSCFLIKRAKEQFGFWVAEMSIHACLRFEFKTNIIQSRQNRTPSKTSGLFTSQILLSNLQDTCTTTKPMYNGHLRALKNLSFFERCPLFKGNLTEIVLSATKHFVCYSRHVQYLGCPLLVGVAALLIYIK